MNKKYILPLVVIGGMVAGEANNSTAAENTSVYDGWKIEIGGTRSFPSFKETNEQIGNISDLVRAQLIPGMKEFDDWSGKLVGNLYVGATKETELNGYRFALGPFMTLSKGSVESKRAGYGILGPTSASLSSEYGSITGGITADFPVYKINDDLRILLNTTLALGYLENSFDLEASAPYAGFNRTVKGSDEAISFGGSLAIKGEYDITDKLGVNAQAGYSLWDAHEFDYKVTDKTSFAGMNSTLEYNQPGKTDTSGTFASLNFTWKF